MIFAIVTTHLHASAIASPSDSEAVKAHVSVSVVDVVSATDFDKPEYQDNFGPVPTETYWETSEEYTARIAKMREQDPAEYLNSIGPAAGEQK